MGSWAIILGVTRDPSDGGDLARNFWEVREEEKSERDQKIAPVCPSPKKPTKGNGTRRGREEALKYGHEKRRPFLPFSPPTQLCTLFKLEYISGLTSGETGANAPVA